MHTQVKRQRDEDETAHLERLNEITERSDGAYTSAFASWANGWRALQWQERQESGRDTEMSEYQKGSLTELKTHV